MLCLAYFLYQQPDLKQQETVLIKPAANNKSQPTELAGIENKPFIKNGVIAKDSKKIKKAAVLQSTSTTNPDDRTNSQVSDDPDTPGLTTSIEPLGLNLYPEELSAPGLNIDDPSLSEEKNTTD